MKIKFFLFIIVTFIIFTSCSKNEINNTPPTIHDTIEIDIDENGVEDFKIKYSYIDIEPLSNSDGNFGITGNLEPLGNNEILRHKDERSLFLRNLGEIEENVIEPLKWRNTFSRTIVSITTKNIEGEWPNKWEINSNSSHSTYFLGLKLVNDNLNQLAWLEIDINKTNGKVLIVNKGIL